MTMLSLQNEVSAAGKTQRETNLARVQVAVSCNRCLTP